MSQDVVDVILRGGETLRLRPPRESDTARSSSSSEPSRSEACTCGSTDSHGSGPRSPSSSSTPTGASAARSSGRSPRPAASASSRSANYVRLRDPAVAEAAFAVADEYQRRGIGTRLVEQLAERAGDRGSSGSSPRCSPKTGGCSESSTSLGFELSREFAGGEVEIAFPTKSTERYEARIDERDHVAVTASLHPFFDPRTVAVVGRFQASWLDRRRAVPQRPRGGLRRCCVPDQPRRHGCRGRARLPIDRGRPGGDRPRRHLRARGVGARGRRAGAR